MECAQIDEAFKPLKVCSHPIPDVPEEGFILKTLYAGICHSDIHFLDDEMDLGNGQIFRNRDLLGDKFSGLVLGHEICGKVLAKGSKVPNSSSVKVGDTVIVIPWRGCQACEVCSNGQSNLCGNNAGGQKDVGQTGRPAEGGYTTHVAIYDWTSVMKIPSTIDPAVGCMLPCSILTAYNALSKARPTLDNAVRTRGVANVLFVGAGGVGLWALVLIKSIFGDKNVKVIIADINSEKLTDASNNGADDALLWPTDSTTEDLVSMTTMSGYNKLDAVLDFVGLPKTCQVGLGCLHNGGVLVVVGLRGGELPISIPSLVARSVSVQGIRTGSRDQLKDLVELFSVQGIETPPPLEYFSLSDINVAHEKLRKGQIKGKALIKFN